MWVKAITVGKELEDTGESKFNGYICKLIVAIFSAAYHRPVATPALIQMLKSSYKSPPQLTLWTSQKVTL